MRKVAQYAILWISSSEWGK